MLSISPPPPSNWPLSPSQSHTKMSTHNPYLWHLGLFMFPVISTIITFSHLKEWVMSIRLLLPSTDSHIRWAHPSQPLCDHVVWDCDCTDLHYTAWLIRRCKVIPLCNQTAVSSVQSTLMAWLSIALQQFGANETTEVNVDSPSSKSLRCCW